MILALAAVVLSIKIAAVKTRINKVRKSGRMLSAFALNKYKKEVNLMVFELDQIKTELSGYHKNLEEMGDSL